MLCVFFTDINEETGKPKQGDERYNAILTLCYSQAMLGNTSKILNTNRYLTCIFTAPDDFFDVVADIHELYTQGELKGQAKEKGNKPRTKPAKGSAGKSDKTSTYKALEESKVF